MNAEDLHALLARGESERVAFGAGTIHPAVAAKVVSAFLNGRGGRLALGVRDRGDVVGVTDAEATAQRLEEELSNLISPIALWTVERVRIADHDVLLIDVPEGQDKPYVVEGTIYVRRGERVVSATGGEISGLVQRRAAASQRWERQIALGADRGDLDDKLILETLRLAVESRRWQGSPDDTESFLNALGLVVHDAVTNAALLLYGTQPTRVLPQARVRLLVLPEGKTGSRYSVDRLFEACLLHAVTEISEVLTSLAGGVESRFSTEEWRRSDRPTYPISALREGVMNALVHREYGLSGSVIIAIVPESLRISNPGGLPDGLKPSDLRKDHPSLPRNPDLAHVCFLQGLIEKVGRGTQRILEDCRHARLRAPLWRSSRLETTLTLFSPVAGARAASEELNERQQRMLAALTERGLLRPNEVARLVGEKVSDRTLRNDLQALVDRGLLLRRGRGRSVSYVSTKHDRR